MLRLIKLFFKPSREKAFLFMFFFLVMFFTFPFLKISEESKSFWWLVQNSPDIEKSRYFVLVGLINYSLASYFFSCAAVQLKKSFIKTKKP